MGRFGWRPLCAATSVATRPASRQPKAAPPLAKGSQQQPGSLTSTATTTASSRLTPEMSLDGPASVRLDEDQATKQSVTVTVRFRPLSPREIRLGAEVAWYADGDTVVRSKQNPNVGYAYDRVFAPTSTTCKVYDVAAQHVVSGAMEGIYGTIIVYGVTSSGKTHTMHGCQRSPGIIPLAVKDAFSIIQETPNREFLLRVSYLEIYNEVLNDLLNPAEKNLRIRNDARGTFVEGIKEEVVVSPAHVLSLIAAGEEHRHVGSTNSNLLSSQSHTVFTLTIESSSYGGSNEGDAVTFSQLHLIDLAGSVSSKAETTGVRLKEGSYINESLVALGKVISKLTDGKATHIPFQDSKLTRLLQSSLSGQGRVSLICTATPASSNSNETHHTLKFSQRAKRIEVQALQNKIIAEKSLIKKYQNEISRLKEELELEQEEKAKSALLARIERLTNLILVSTKATQTSRFSPNPGRRRRHSFGEEVSIKTVDHVAHHTSVLKRLTEEAARNPKSENIQMKMEENIEEIKAKQQQIASLEKQIPHSLSDSQVKVDKLDLSPVKTTNNRVIQDLQEKTSECIEEHLSQALQAKDSLSNVIVMQKSPVVNQEAQQHSDKEKTVPGEINAEPLQNKQEVSCLINRLLRLIRDMKQQMTYLQKQIPCSLSDSQVKVDKLDPLPSYVELPEELNEKSFELKTSECMEEHLPQTLQAKDSLSNVIVMQKSTVVNQEPQQHGNQEKTVPREISAEPLQNKQQVSCLANRLLRQIRDMKQLMATLEEQTPHSLSDSQLKV